MTPSQICRYKYLPRIQYSRGGNGIDGEDGSAGTIGTLTNSEEINW